MYGPTAFLLTGAVGVGVTEVEVVDDAFVLVERVEEVVFVLLDKVEEVVFVLLDEVVALEVVDEVVTFEEVEEVVGLTELDVTVVYGGKTTLLL